MWRPLISGPPTQIKSPLHPQPYCSSSVLPLSSRGRLAAIVPRLTGTSLARILLAKSEKSKRHSVTVTISISAPHPLSGPRGPRRCPSCGQPVPGSSQTGGQRGTPRSASSASWRRREPPQRRPSRGIAASRRTTVSPLPRRGLGHAQDTAPTTTRRIIPLDQTAWSSDDDSR